MIGPVKSEENVQMKRGSRGGKVKGKEKKMIMKE